MERDVFRDAMVQPFREQLIDLWSGKLFQQREVVNYSLEGATLHLHLQFSVLPGRERLFPSHFACLAQSADPATPERPVFFSGEIRPRSNKLNVSWG